jgi:cytochrome c2
MRERKKSVVLRSGDLASRIGHISFVLIALAILSLSLPAVNAVAAPATSAEPETEPGSAPTQNLPAPAAGRKIFDQCRGCHSLSPSQNGRGPTLYHLFGRRAGSVPGFLYSPAMKNSVIVWTAGTLDRFLRNPRAFVPGGKMTSPDIKDPRDRKNLLAFLREATK